MYDLIGDIHGHAAELRQLLLKLGYQPHGKGYRHPSRQAFFVGDYIDRGPEIPATLEIVRSMVDAGDALALMGNHEFNALAFHTPLAGGGHLRPHLIKNFRQHAETLLQFQNRQSEYDDYIRWFYELPLYYESEEFRAVHASWHADSISHLQRELHDGRLSEEVLLSTAASDSPTLDAIEKVLKGVELPLPAGRRFLDKDGTPRHHIRYKWWENPIGANYEQLSVLPGLELADLAYVGGGTEYYGPEEKPVFFGHYWLRGAPSLYRGNVCCLDYSVAKGGELVAYRFEGEGELREELLVSGSVDR